MKDTTCCKSCGYDISKSAPFCVKCGSTSNTDVIYSLFGTVATLCLIGVGLYFVFQS